jgi:hypothetical protein
MPRRHFTQCRTPGGTRFNRERTARPEGTIGRRIGRAGDVPGQDLPLGLGARIRRGNVRQQRSCIGMGWVGIELGGGRYHP